LQHRICKRNIPSVEANLTTHISWKQRASNRSRAAGLSGRPPSFGMWTMRDYLKVGRLKRTSNLSARPSECERSAFPGGKVASRPRHHSSRTHAGHMFGGFTRVDGQRLLFSRCVAKEEPMIWDRESITASISAKKMANSAVSATVAFGNAKTGRSKIVILRRPRTLRKTRQHPLSLEPCSTDLGEWPLAI
jgi:hypothetical protein